MSRTPKSVAEALFENRDNFWAIWFGAICLTVVGDTTFEVLTAFSKTPSPRDWSIDVRDSAFWIRMCIFLLASFLLYFAATLLQRAIRAGQEVQRVGGKIVQLVTRSSGQKTFAGWRGDVPPSPALVLFISIPRTSQAERGRFQRVRRLLRRQQVNVDQDKTGRSHESAINYHLNTPTAGAGPLRYVRLVASAHPGSIKEAERVKNQLGGEHPAMNVEVLQGLDFFSIPDMHEVTRTLVMDALHELSDNETPEQIVIDITGGTAPVSVGAVLASMELDATLQYVEPGKTEDNEISFQPEYVTIRRMAFEEAPLETGDTVVVPIESAVIVPG